MTSSGRCPICKAAEVKAAFETVRDDLSSRPRYIVRRCASCGHLWAEGEVTKALYAEIYSQYFYSSSQQSAPHAADGSLLPQSEHYPPIANARRRVASLRERGLSGRLLDLGCGVGYFVLAAQRGFDAEGMEIEDTAIEKARKIGVSVRQGDALAPRLPDEPLYDVVTLWDVFSGFTEPAKSAASMLDRVRPGGRLVLTVPDGQSMAAIWGGRRWPLMIPPGNMHFYSEQSIKALFSFPSVQSVEIWREAKLVSVSFLAHKLLRSLGFYRLAKANLPLHPAWKIPLNLGDIMTVMVTKKLDPANTHE